jgi:hypothetical protein
MNKKRTIATLASMIIGISSIPITMVNAKVIEPKIVKTETWTTSYYIDDDIETLYPYIDCQADIYNDGTVKVSFWNTHEWDGFANVKHNVTILRSVIVSNNSHGQLQVYDSTTHNRRALITYPFKLSYYHKDYSYSYYLNSSGFCESVSDSILYVHENELGNYEMPYATFYTYYGSLPEMPVNAKSEFILTPKVCPIETYDFDIFEHNFTITPELLSGNVIAEPQLSETEQKIKALEEENAKLKEENNNLQRVLASYGNRAYGDMNNDNIVDGRDATILLTYYAKTSVGYTGTLDDFIKEQNGG